MENKDIVPELLEKIKEKYKNGVASNGLLREIYDLIANKNISYEDAQHAAQEIGKILSGAYDDVFVQDVLPDGKMYYNIAERIVGTTMQQAYSDIADIAEHTQNVLNENAGLGLKAIRPELNQDRIDGIVNRLSTAEKYADVAWILQAPIQTFCQSVIDDSVKANAEFQGESGLRPKIIRKTVGKCCDWCSRLAGAYLYPDVPKDVYRRHDRCRCTVEYDPGSGRRQNVHTKQWTDVGMRDKIEERKKIGLEKPTLNFKNKDLLQKHFAKHQSEYGEISIPEYLRLATQLAEAPLSDDVVQLKRSDNSIAKYRFSTNDFIVINEDGTVRTFFKPADKEMYWKYEIERN